jgi:hypothetical protein
MKRNTTPQLRTEAAREAFLDRNWPTSEDLSQSWGASAEVRSKLASKLRREKRLFGVWSPRRSAYVYPTFQFLNQDPDSQASVLPALPALLTALETIPGFSDSEMDVAGGDPGRWRRLFWLYEPRGELSEQSLAVTAAVQHSISPLRALSMCSSKSEAPRAPAEIFAEAPDAVIALANDDATDDRDVL